MHTWTIVRIFITKIKPPPWPRRTIGPPLGDIRPYWLTTTGD